ncbi:MAG TPA: DUF4394 domain-containing protein [Saprospiraceae bacterium]|nr:DUF4394 domain-containing protein [Saprospiraceae bacterium]
MIAQTLLRSRILIGLLTLIFGCSTLHAQTIFALSGNKLISFKASAPGNIQSNVSINGIASGFVLEGLDFRPNTGQLYALGYQQNTGLAQLYTIQPATGMATAIGASPVMLRSNMGKISMDFNPTVDRIRVTGSNNANYRMHPVTGAVVATDMDLAFAASDVNAGTNPSAGACAYTNSYIAATATTLYNYDDSLNVFTTQIPPNNGTLNTIGASGIAVNLNDPSSDFDIYFDAAAGVNKAYFTANTGTQTADQLYTVNLATGVATAVGMVGNSMNISDIAVMIERNVPAIPNGPLMYALTSNNNLISVDLHQPELVRSIIPVTGLAMGQVLSGMDIRPATGELYGLGYNAGNGEASLYTLNTMTGVATMVGATPMLLKPNMGKISMDFNPTVDRIRVTGSDNANYRLHPVTGVLAATDMNLGFAASDVNAGKDPSVGAGAYTNSFAGATTTTLYNYEDSLNVLTTQIPPNNGVLNTIGGSGIMVNLADPSTDMDILFSPYGDPNKAYLVANTGNSNFDQLYSLNLATGQATIVGKIGNGIAITDIAIALQSKEPACDIKVADCVTFEVLGISKNAAGDKTYRIRVTNNCADKLNYVAFQLPNGITAVSPSQNGMYDAPSGHVYDVRNPNFSPFYSIRFKDQNTDGISTGQADLFEYTLPATANPSYIMAMARVGNLNRTTYLNIFSCSVSSSRPDEADEREADETVTTNFKFYPNPSSGVLFADLSQWTDESLLIKMYNGQGQMVVSQNLTGGDPQQPLEIDSTWPNGFYFLEMTTPTGERLMQKFLLQQP